MLGIDISDWQGVPDFNLVRGAGYEFCIIKATEGLNTVNRYVHQQAEAAKASGMKIGYYHFGHPEVTTHTPTDEVNHFANILKTLPDADIIPALDVEQAKTAPVGLHDWIIGFMNGLGQDCMLYSNPGYLNAYLPSGHDLGRFKLWLSEYCGVAVFPRGWADYAIWQNSGSGLVPGIVGNCDTDVSDNLPLIQSV